MKMDRFEASEIQIKTRDGKLIEGQKFSATEGAGTDVEFVCTIHGIESEPCKVHLIADPVMDFPTITVPGCYRDLSIGPTRCLRELMPTIR